MSAQSEKQRRDSHRARKVKARAEHAKAMDQSARILARARQRQDRSAGSANPFLGLVLADFAAGPFHRALRSTS